MRSQAAHTALFKSSNRRFAAQAVCAALAAHRMSLAL